MPSYIVKIDNFYLEWSTVVDAPTTFGMSLDEFKEYYQEEYGKRAMSELSQRLERVEEQGVSSYLDNSLEDLVLCNRAGPKETELSLNRIKQAFCDRDPIVVKVYEKDYIWDPVNGKLNESFDNSPS
jgi:hypothetical protein